MQAQRLYCRTLAAIHAQAVSKRAVCRSRHGWRLLAGRSLASVAATYVKRLAFVIGCVRSRASVCTSSAGRRAVARHALVMQRVSAVTAQAMMRQCLCRSRHIRVCAADTLKRYCVTKRLMAAKRDTLLKNAAVIKILFARRRAQFYRRWYNRLVGRSVRVMQCVPQTLPSPLQPPICPNVFLQFTRSLQIRLHPRRRPAQSYLPHCIIFPRTLRHRPCGSLAPCSPAPCRLTSLSDVFPANFDGKIFRPSHADACKCGAEGGCSVCARARSMGGAGQGYESDGG